jgi:replicative DNA helicase
MTDLTSPRLPPQNLEAEQSVLGAILLDNDALNKVMDALTEEDFYRTAHRQLFRAMLELDERNEAIDQVTLTEYLKGEGQLEAVGGSAYIAELGMMVPSAANARYHARIVRDKSVLRGLITVSTEIITNAYEGTAAVDQLLDNAERSVFGLAQGRLGRTFAPIKETIERGLEIIEAFYTGQRGLTGIPTGFYDLDGKLSGLQPSDLVVIAGRPSMGKTSLALGLAAHAATEHHKKVGIFSLEMSKEQLVVRMLSSKARLDSHSLRTGKIQTKEEWKRLVEAAEALSHAPIFIDDSGALTVQQMRGKARRLQKEQKGLDLLIVDYLQLMQGRADAESRQQEISDISRSLKALAKELQVPVVALSQLSRAVESRKPPIPMLADLRESGAIEQDADVVIFIYREDVYNPDTERKGIAEILLSKHRNGPTGKVELLFHEKYASFENLADGESV